MDVLISWACRQTGRLDRLIQFHASYNSESFFSYLKHLFQIESWKDRHIASSRCRAIIWSWTNSCTLISSKELMSVRVVFCLHVQSEGYQGVSHLSSDTHYCRQPVAELITRLEHHLWCSVGRQLNVSTHEVLRPIFNLDLMHVEAILLQRILPLRGSAASDKHAL